ncbi:MAG: hypothetical protein QM786_15970 [Breznakibacter sp.]
MATLLFWCDYPESITYPTENNSLLAQKLSLDAWGHPRSPGTQTAYASSNGHGHLSWFGLNLYDPVPGNSSAPTIMCSYPILYAELQLEQSPDIQRSNGR